MDAEIKNRGNQNIYKSSISNTGRWLLLVILDLLALNGGFLLSLFYRHDYELNWMLVKDNPVWFLLLNGLWFFLGYFFQIYDLQRAGRFDSAFFKVIGVSLLTLGIFNFIPYFPPVLPPSRQPLFISILLPVVLIFIERGLYVWGVRNIITKNRVLIVGAGRSGRTVCRVLHNRAQMVYQVVGFIDDDPQKTGELISIKQTDSGKKLENPILFPVLGSSRQLLEIVSQQKVSIIVTAVTSEVNGELYQVLSDSMQQGVQIISMPLLYEQITGKVPVEHISDQWSVAMPLIHPGLSHIWRVNKRLFDLFWVFFGLLFLAAAFPLIAAAIYLDSPGPILYTQKRLGLNGKPFKMYKFRSMIPGAESGKAVWAEMNDPRITRVGKFLRKMHLDEFPQFFNILKGEMSVVGPRPERPQIVEQLAEDIPFFRVRQVVKPGMAGWGLIHHGYGASVEDAIVKLQYDLYYIKHQSLWLDLYILSRTFRNAIRFRGR